MAIHSLSCFLSLLKTFFVACKLGHMRTTATLISLRSQATLLLRAVSISLVPSPASLSRTAGPSHNGRTLSHLSHASFPPVLMKKARNSTNSTYFHLYCPGLSHHSALSHQRQFRCPTPQNDPAALPDRLLRIGGETSLPSNPVPTEKMWSECRLKREIREHDSEMLHRETSLARKLELSDLGRRH